MSTPKSWKRLGHRVLEFGKIDYAENGRKAYPVEIEMELRKSEDNEIEFTASGGVWNTKRTDYVCCGQMIDDPDVVDKIRVNRKLYLEVMDLWTKYHNNCGRCYTPKQEEELTKHFGCWNAVEYEARKEYLESIGLLQDTYNGKTYTYGEDFVYWPIPEWDLNRIKQIIDTGK